ncbi:putative hydrolase of the HAD superfamily [Arachidicoccus rhizosphaerae]|uniref:Putative hydrolase of the HAD superfamily n=1 Tax=Arachidicoccus rhizosphaerae TaxID=551991 RepID=A0A1H3WA49_9BACT|nr:HAD family phosphatase [Arachidicoccus rhizosphaerae]SDZ83212.1 putative hydrolase of the HAD superfamily [Arachidicoccus rhizosphaerae]
MSQQEKSSAKIRAIFTDIGGVLLNNGWDRTKRALAVKTFGLDAEELNERHHLTFDTYESGKITLDEYLNRIVFYTPRDFTREEFKAFMFAQSEAIPEMIELISDLKKKHDLHIVVVSNEGRELNDHRIRHFGLDKFVDAFISSSFVHIRKPDEDIFKLALDIAQMRPEQVVFIDDRPMFVQVASLLGIKGIVHKDYNSTKAMLASLLN